MKVIHLSTYDKGGAGMAAYRIHRLFLDEGHDSSMYVKEKSRDDDSLFVVGPAPLPLKSESVFKSLARKILPRSLKNYGNFFLQRKTSGEKKYAFYSKEHSRETGICSELEKIPCDANIILVHWTVGFLNLYDIEKISRTSKARIYIIAMDMEPITGGCHYAWDCKQYETDCSNCPALEDKEFAKNQLHHKIQALEKIGAGFIAFSKKYVELAKRSKLPYTSYHLMPLPLDLDIFHPIENSRSSREEIILFSNGIFYGHERKGGEFLTQTLEIVTKKYGKKIRLLCLDTEYFKQFKNRNLSFEKFNYVTDRKDLANLYQRSDVFLCTSVQDQGPAMTLEALACGIPVVSLPEGYAKEVIENEENGFVTNSFSTEELAERLNITIEKGVRMTPMEIHNRLKNTHGKSSWVDSIDEILNHES